MNFVCIVFEIGDKMLTLSSMENLIVQCVACRILVFFRCLCVITDQDEDTCVQTRFKESNAEPS